MLTFKYKAQIKSKKIKFQKYHSWSLLEYESDWSATIINPQQKKLINVLNFNRFLN